MRRALVLAGVVVVGMLAAVPAAFAADASSHDIEFELRANGFQVGVKSEAGGAKEGLVLTLYRKGEVAYYEVPAEITEDTVKARFGQLGELDYTFAPARSGDCAGIYEGTFDFTGENDYVSFEVGRVRGTLDGPGTKTCKPPGGHQVGMHADTETEEAHAAEEEASLLAHTARPLPLRSVVVFEYEAKGRRRVIFSAFEYEEEEGMTIARGAQAAGRPHDFTWNLKAGTAGSPRRLRSAAARPSSGGPADTRRGVARCACRCSAGGRCGWRVATSRRS
jgi:hypothetical protein